MDGVETSLRASALNLPEGGLLPEHEHRWDQLAYAVQGVMAVETEQGCWVVPPHRAVWLPASVPHRIRAGGPLAMRNVYFPPDTVRALPRRCCVVGVGRASIFTVNAFVLAFSRSVEVSGSGVTALAVGPASIFRMNAFALAF